MRTTVAGALAGFVATAAMTIAMEALYTRLPRAARYALPPAEITAAVLRRSGLATASGPVATHAAHFGYGAAAGALFGRFDGRGASVLKGAAYGIGVWVVSYLGWLPAAGILRPATRHRAPRNALMIAAHVVWGATTGALFRRLAR